MYRENSFPGPLRDKYTDRSFVVDHRERAEKMKRVPDGFFFFFFRRRRPTPAGRKRNLIRGSSAERVIATAGDPHLRQLPITFTQPGLSSFCQTFFFLLINGWTHFHKERRTVLHGLDRELGEEVNGSSPSLGFRPQPSLVVVRVFESALPS